MPKQKGNQRLRLGRSLGAASRLCSLSACV